MAVVLSVDAASCIRCEKCVKICPSLIFAHERTSAPISLVEVENCISCGHCVAVCPTHSVLHSNFPPQCVHPIDRSKLPTPDQMMLLCRARRSNRAFTQQPIPAEYLDMILEAAHRAPTASNRQQIAFTRITDPVKLQMISRFTVETFAAIARKLENPILRPILSLLMPEAYKYLPAFHRIEREFTHGRDLILRGATAVILIHAPSQNTFGLLDANLAYQNGSLMAESLGVSQFYTGFVYTAIQRDKHNKLALALGIDGTIHAGMALGMPQFLFPNYIDKRPIIVND